MSTRGGKQRTAAGTVENFETDLVFENAYLIAKTWLGHKKTLSRPIEIERLSKFYDAVHLLRVHQRCSQVRLGCEGINRNYCRTRGMLYAVYDMPHTMCDVLSRNHRSCKVPLHARTIEGHLQHSGTVASVSGGATD